MKDLFEEIADFFEDFIEVFTREEIHHHDERKANISGHLELVRPAYIFAERLDYFFKIVFGVSIFISAFTTTYVGFIKLSDLLDFLTKSTLGRGIMLVIGASYMLLGARGAWEEFKTTQEGLLPSDQHKNTHAFGSILYKAKGIESVNVCDNSFIYGCYHSVLGEAIADNGEPAIIEANKFCNKLSDWDIVACQHGIGHGIMGTTSFDFRGLEDSLDQCKKIGDLTLLGCSNGVFMEYNFKTLHTGTKEFRKPDPSNLFFPCDKLPNNHRKQCYFAQPQWWITVSRGKMSERYRYVGNLCKKLNHEQMLACSLGMGAVAPEAAKWQVKTAVSLCNTLDDSTLETYCRAGAANLRSYNKKREFCSGLRDKMLDVCLNMSYVN